VISKNVAAALLAGRIDYGVMAIENSVAGKVQETKSVMDCGIELCCQTSMPIHHCLFVKNPEAKIKFITSHIQALKQTEQTCKQILPNAIAIECADTALAAKMLHNGAFSEEYAVICKKDTGLSYKLHLLAENVEDDKSNATVFGLFKLK
jgi:prephenate dehydratase